KKNQGLENLEREKLVERIKLMIKSEVLEDKQFAIRWIGLELYNSLANDSSKQRMQLERDFLCVTAGSTKEEKVFYASVVEQFGLLYRLTPNTNPLVTKKFYQILSSYIGRLITLSDELLIVKAAYLLYKLFLIPMKDPGPNAPFYETNFYVCKDSISRLDFSILFSLYYRLDSLRHQSEKIIALVMLIFNMSSKKFNMSKEGALINDLINNTGIIGLYGSKLILGLKDEDFQGNPLIELQKINKPL
ncbi:hypothetical protein ROZALSC1DRAFT_26459, partial [Rozella allomycis CSF55]